MHKLKSNYIKLEPKDRLYNTSRPIIGLTGGVASGKSTASKILMEQGIPLIDADQLIKYIYTLPKTVEFVTELIPSAINRDQIDFTILREEFFKNDSLKKKLENYLYKELPNAFEQEYAKISFNKYDFLIYDAALLFEKKLHLVTASNILIFCSEAEQIKRLVKRDNISSQLAKKIIENQMSLHDKKKLADIPIENTESVLELESKLLELLGSIFEK